MTAPDNPRKLTCVNLVSTIRSSAEPPFPVRSAELCVFLQLTDCRGPGDCRVEIRHADSDRVVFRTRTRTAPLGTDPLDVYGVTFRVRNCTFPEPGLYWVQFWYDEKMTAQQPVLLR